MSPGVLVAVQVIVGAAGGVGVAVASLAILRRQVAALAAGQRARGALLGGLVGRLLLIGGGMVAALAWSPYCGIAYAAALVLTRQIVIRKARVTA